MPTKSLNLFKNTKTIKLLSMQQQKVSGGTVIIMAMEENLAG